MLSQSQQQIIIPQKSRHHNHTILVNHTNKYENNALPVTEILNLYVKTTLTP
jgi:hypothetical protein